MSPRAPLLLAVSAAALVLVACTGSSTAAPVTTSTPAPPSAPDPTPVPGSTFLPEPTATPIVGGVDGDLRGPELTVILVDANTFMARIEDPAAKAWQLEVRGTGDRARDAWQITVEVGDVGPLIGATEIVDGQTIDELDLSGIWDGTAIAGGCHSTLPVCLDTDGFQLPENGDGRLSVELHLEDVTTALELRGAAAYWDGEPFILGPWHSTEAFPWEPAAG